MNTPGDTPPLHTPDLALRLQGAQLVAELRNTGYQPLALYTRACAPGCAAYLLRVTLGDGHHGHHHTLRERARVWTRHGPVLARLGPDQVHREVFDADTPGWDLADWPPAAMAMLAQPVVLQLVLDIAADPTQGMPALRAVSNELVSPPPQRWLGLTGPAPPR